MAVQFNGRYLNGFVAESEFDAIAYQVEAARRLLEERRGPGHDFLGWIDLPEKYDRAEFERVKAAAARIRSDSDVLVVIGIGGSYLGARAAVELLKSPLYNSLRGSAPAVYFVGNSLNPGYLNEVIGLCEGKDVSVNVISKSGTTTEPAIAFRIFRELLVRKYGREGAKKRIYATTDRAHGTLKELADREGYETFVIPDDVGGRYSVLTPVGLLPIAAAGGDIGALMRGAAAARSGLAAGGMGNACLRYAAARNILSRRGRSIEILVSYEPAFAMMGEWWKQLFGESEGKDGKGLFPASAVFSTDLHSMGQFIQQGSRTMFETVVHFARPKSDIRIGRAEGNADGLNFLSGRTMQYVNDRAFEGTALAHADGGVPSVVLEVPQVNETELGYLIYFFEKACAVSGYLLGVNPFDQPGVESYKKNMFALLGKPGYETQKAALEARLGRR